MTISDQEIKCFISAIKKSSPYDLRDYSHKSLKRRVTKILNDNKLDFSSLIRKISENNDFLESTVREITVNTTELFRDPPVWQTIKYEILPKFKNHESIRIWHAGCSTGQEVYSLLILLYELNMFEKTIIYGTDLNATVIYSAFIIDLDEAVTLFEGIAIAIFAVLMTIIGTVIAVIIYVVLGILQIVLRKFKTISIICNVFTAISIILSIRAIAIFAGIGEFSILLTVLMMLYIIIFSLCIVSYMKFRKEG